MTIDVNAGTDNISHNHKVARDLARKGVAVFPCRASDGPPDAFGNPQWKAKQPMPRIKWKEGATTDLEIIDAWWKDTPEALVGMPLAPLNILVLDPDQHPGSPDGIAAFDLLAMQYPGLLGGPYVQTPQGRHYIYQQTSPPHGNSEGTLPPGINVRGVGGYVIAPGSVLPDGRGWTMVNFKDNPPKPLPPAIAAMITGKPFAEAKAEQPSGSHSAYVEASIKNACDKVIHAIPGTRNNTLNTQAVKLGHFVGAGMLDEQTAIEALTEAAIQAGLDSGEIGPTIRSGLAKGKTEPFQPDVTSDFWDGDIDTPEAPKPAGRIHRATDMWNAPKPEYLIDGMIPKGGVGLLIGDTQTFKSFIAQSIALAVSQGHPTWQEHPINAPPGASVLYVAGEGGLEGAAIRMRAWAAHNGLTQDTFQDRFRLITFPINLTDQKSTLALIKLIKQEIDTPIAFIVLDTLNTSAPGAEENSTKEMGTLYAVARRIGQIFSATVMGVHHTNKQGKSRGANLLQQNADFLLFMERKDFATMNTTLTVTKLKDGASGHNEHYHLDLVALPDTTTSLTPTRIGSLQAERTETTARGRPSSKADAVLDVLRASRNINGESFSEICAILDITERKEKNAISQILRRLFALGQVTRDNSRSRWRVVDVNDFLE